MSAKWIRRIIGLVIAALVVGAGIYSQLPQPILVDIATVDNGPMSVTVDEDGVARIKDVFRVSTPIPGKMGRTPISVGDRVERDQTIVANIMPVDPPFLDARSRREVEAAIEAALSSVVLAEAQLHGAEAAERLLESDLERAERLATAGTISSRALEKARTDLVTAQAQVEQATAALALRRSEMLSAQARLIEPDKNTLSSNEDDVLAVTAPVDGVVLKVLAESEQVLAAGTPLLEIGDPADMEVIVHLLSTDAVAIEEGAAASLSDWGGEGDLAAKVRRIDPAAYTKISALGIEEQRVDAVLDIVDTPDAWQGLGHEFRVAVRISLWDGDNVLRVPIAALFRQGGEWAVFTATDGVASVQRVEIGRRNNETAEVLGGLQSGDPVILHPSDKIVEGVQVQSREAEAG